MIDFKELRSAFDEFEKKKENVLIGELVRLFNDGTLVLYKAKDRLEQESEYKYNLEGGLRVEVPSVKKLAIAVEALEFVVKNSGASADYNLKARQALEKVNG